MSSSPRPSSLLAPFCYTARYHCPIKATEPQHIGAGPNPSLPPSRATARAAASSPIRRPLDSSLRSQCFLDSLLVSPAFLYTAPFPFCLLQTPSKLSQISYPRDSGLCCPGQPLYRVKLLSSAQTEPKVQVLLRPLKSGSWLNTVSTNKKKSISFPQVLSQYLLAFKPSQFNI